MTKGDEIANNILECALRDNKIILDTYISKYVTDIVEYYYSMLEYFDDEEFINQVYDKLEQLVRDELRHMY